MIISLNGSKKKGPIKRYRQIGIMEEIRMQFKMISCNEEDAEFIEERAGNAFNLIAQPEEDEEEFVYIITDESGDLLGGCILSVDGLKTASIYDMWVEEEYRDQGIGSQLLAELEREVKENGVDVMFIEAFDWNVGFFKKNGYERVTGMHEDYPKGHVMYCMEKPL